MAGYAANLPEDVTESDLSDVFGSLEGFVTCRKAPCKQFAFVDFRTMRDAKAAVARMQGEVFSGKRLTIQLCDLLRQGRGRPKVTDASTPVPPTSLPPEYFDQLRHHLRACSGLRSQICRYGRTCVHSTCRNTHPDGREIEDDPSKCMCPMGEACRDDLCFLLHPPGGREIDKDIHISNISFDTSVDDLYRAFSVTKGLISMRLVRDSRTNKPTGLAVAGYESIELAEKARNALQHLRLNGQKLRVSLVKAENASAQAGASASWSQEGEGRSDPVFNAFTTGQHASKQVRDDLEQVPEKELKQTAATSRKTERKQNLASTKDSHCLTKVARRSISPSPPSC
eukprot:TRINITY_DN5227_c0_g1_i2.p1 TRINITY_DN5227_c0_g1~~TRINITY_DN5227_c0_g1_i2.p1  ORF type:complete len:341 (-),score=57.44 TRINITY_DN5227_c0_g1_i2:465-1487(-)